MEKWNKVNQYLIKFWRILKLVGYGFQHVWFAFGLNALIFVKTIPYCLTSEILSYCNWVISYRIELILSFQAMKIN